MRKTLAALVCAGSVMTLGVQSAQAKEADPWFTPTADQTETTAVADSPSTGTYSSTGATTASQTTSLASANPAGCTTKTLWPHASSHVPGTINAGVQQTCPTSVAKNSVEAKLWEKRIWGYNVIDGPRYSDIKTRSKSTVYTNAGCRKNSIRVTGYGHYEWAGTHIRSAEVSKTVDIDC